jgi:hypothetical protein
MRFFVIAPVVLALAACAAPAPEPAQQVALSSPDAKPAELECHQESSMGSNLIHKVCTPKQTDAQRAEMQAEIASQLHTMGTHSLPKGN